MPRPPRIKRNLGRRLVAAQWPDSMDSTASKSLPAIGFLTVAHFPEHGWFGGYLAVSDRGRPVEFRCTTPVQPSRAQEILYGRTLLGYLHSEVIGHPLIAAADCRPQLLLTDVADMLGLSLLDDVWIGHVEPADGDALAQSGRAVADGPNDAHEPVVVNGYVVTPGTTCSKLDDGLRQTIIELSQHIELDEPFERLRAALREVVAGSVDASGEDHDFAAA